MKIFEEPVMEILVFTSEYVMNNNDDEIMEISVSNMLPPIWNA